MIDDDDIYDEFDMADAAVYGAAIWGVPLINQCAGWEFEPQCRMNDTICKLEKCTDGKNRCQQHAEMYNAQQRIRKNLVRPPNIPDR